MLLQISMEWLRLTLQAFFRYNSSPGILLRARTRQYIATTGSMVMFFHTRRAFSLIFDTMFTTLIPSVYYCMCGHETYTGHRKHIWATLWITSCLCMTVMNKPPSVITLIFGNNIMTISTGVFTRRLKVKTKGLVYFPHITYKQTNAHPNSYRKTLSPSWKSEFGEGKLGYQVWASW